jgi:hypothetical protein
MAKTRRKTNRVKHHARARAVMGRIRAERLSAKKQSERNGTVATTPRYGETFLRLLVWARRQGHGWIREYDWPRQRTLASKDWGDVPWRPTTLWPKDWSTLRPKLVAAMVDDGLLLEGTKDPRTGCDRWCITDKGKQLAGQHLNLEYTL